MGLGKKQEGRKESKKGGGSNWSQLNWGPNIADTSFFFRFFSITELQPMTGTSRRIPSPFEVSKKHTWGKNNKTVKEYWKQVWKIKKMAAETRRYFFWLSKTFSGNFLRAGHPSRVQVKFQGKQQQEKTAFITILGLKDCGGFKGRQEMSGYKVVPFAISANFGCNLSANVYAGENPYKKGEFLVGF